MVSDEELASQMQQGSEAAFEEMIKRYHGPIHGYILKLSGDYHATHDIVQDIFIKMCTAIQNYRPELSFKAWLYSIAVNTYKDYKKTAYMRKVIPGLDEMKYSAATTVTPEEAFLRDDEKMRLIQEVNNLGEIYRETLFLRYYNDLKLREISSILNIPIGTVKSRLANGLLQLKRIFSAKEV